MTCLRKNNRYSYNTLVNLEKLHNLLNCIDDATYKDINWNGLLKDAYPLLMGCLSLAVWGRVNEERKGRKRAEKRIIFAILRGINGWAQSMGAPPSIVALW